MKKKKHRTAVVTGAVISALLIAAASIPAGVFAAENIPVTIDVNITYIVEGNAGTAGGDRFTLTADDPQAPMPEGCTGGEKTITVRDEGSFSFGSIYYDRPEIWWYTITREATKKKGVTKDTTVYRVKVIALNDGHGYVLAYKDGSDDKTELIYTDRVAPATGDTNKLIYPGAALAAAGAALVFAAVRRRFRKERIRSMLALMFALLLCVSAVPCFAEEDGIISAGAEQTESAAAEEPGQTEGAVPNEKEPEQTAGAEQTGEEAEQDEGSGSKQEEDIVKAAPRLRASKEAVIEYESKSIAKSRQFWSKDGKYIGCCCQAGTEPAASGTAAMSKVENASLLARIAYYYGWREDWIHDYTVISGFQQHTNAARFMYIVQISQQGMDTWKKWAVSNNFSKKIREDAIACFEEAEKLDITAPDGFECYICTPVNGSQKFILFKYNEESTRGTVTLQKISGNTDITG